MVKIETGERAVVQHRTRAHGRRAIVARLSGDTIIYRLINCEELQIGALVAVRTTKGLKLEIKGGVEIEKQKTRSTVTIYKPGWLSIRQTDQGQTRLRIYPAEPPAQSPKQMLLVGPGAYWAHAGLWDWPLRTWIDKTADAGMNYIRLILPSQCWLPGYPQSFFKRRGATYYLGELDEPFLNKFAADCWYARSRGVVLHIDLLDGHLERYGDAWSRSEFNGENNDQGFPLPEHYISGDVSPWRKVFEHAIKGEVGPYPYPELMGRYGRAINAALLAIVLAIPQGHIVGDGNELFTRSLSRHVLSGAPYIFKCYGNEDLRDEGIDWVADDAELRGQTSFVVFHGTDIDDWVEGRSPRTWRQHADGLMQKWPNVKVLLSTDGTGGGSERLPLSERRARVQAGNSRPGRPTYAELEQILALGQEQFGERFAGLGDIKILGIDTETGRQDADGLFNHWKRRTK